MSFVPSPTQSQVQAALRAFLLSILPAGVDVIQGQDNRVPAPSGLNYVVVTAIRRERLETNTDTYADVAFIASIAGNVMTVASIIFGTIMIGSTLFGVNVLPGTLIQSGPAGGGIGSYQVSQPQAITLEKMAAGNELLLQPVKLTYQLDVYGPNSPDNAQTISTLFRDDRATQFWLDAGFTTSTPLYADDPRQIPFVDENQQVETRWIVEAQIQANQVVTMPQQFADQLKVLLHVIPHRVDFTDDFSDLDFNAP